MDFEKYKNRFPYKTQGDDPAANEAYYREEGRQTELFWQDAFQELGIPLDHPKAAKIRGFAWEQGHAYGFSEVFSCLIDIWEVVKD